MSPSHASHCAQSLGSALALRLLTVQEGDRHMNKKLIQGVTWDKRENRAQTERLGRGEFSSAVSQGWRRDRRGLAALGFEGRVGVH